MRWLAFSLLAVALQLLFHQPLYGGESQNQDMESAFLERYQAYVDFMESPKAVFLSDSDGSSTREYKAIVDLGMRALPFLMERLEADPRLWGAVRLIANKQFIREELDAADGDWIVLYLKWWKEERHKEGEIFRSLFDEWKRAKEQGEEDLARDLYGKMTRRGVPILPYVIEEIRNGEADLLPMVASVTRGAVKRDATPEECLEWWAENKEQWTLPPEDEEAEPVDEPDEGQQQNSVDESHEPAEEGGR